MIKAIDHLVILVRDLAEAIAAYERIGFTVTPGGEHPMVGTHNALIPFADGSYLEVAAFKEPDRPHEHRWWRQLAAGGGLVDYALGSDDLTGDVAKVAGHRMPFDVAEGSRRRPDGQLVAWRTATPRDQVTASLPFLIQDVTPRSLRVPEGAARRHHNGVVGVAGAYVAADDLASAGRAYGALLGEPGPVSAWDSRLVLTIDSFRLADATIGLLDRAELPAILPAGAAGHRPGIMAAALTAPGQKAGRWLDPGETLGAFLYVGG